MRTVLLALGMVAAAATAAGAHECPALQAQIDKELGRRFDKSATEARAMAGEAWKLHQAGKHAESVKKYDEAAKAGGITLTHKK